jgi:chemotaxis protein CheX
MRLPGILDFTAAKPLWESLTAARGQALALDASEVERLGAPCLQVLLAAKSAWAADNTEFHIAAPSPAFVAAASTMGFDHNLERVVS